MLLLSIGSGGAEKDNVSLEAIHLIMMPLLMSRAGFLMAPLCSKFRQIFDGQSHSNPRTLLILVTCYYQVAATPTFLNFCTVVFLML